MLNFMTDVFLLVALALAIVQSLALAFDLLRYACWQVQGKQKPAGKLVRNPAGGADGVRTPQEILPQERTAKG